MTLSHGELDLVLVRKVVKVRPPPSMPRPAP